MSMQPLLFQNPLLFTVSLDSHPNSVRWIFIIPLLRDDVIKEVMRMLKFTSSKEHSMCLY